MNKMTVLYPFIEDGYNEQTASFIEELSWIRRSRRIDMLITVDKPGRISALLKKAGLSYEEIPFSRPVGSKDFYFTALYKLVRSSLPLFFYFRNYKIHAMHCPDLISLLCWGNTAKMNRVRFIVSLQDAARFSHYASLMLADAAKLVCRTEDVRGKIPPRFSSVSLLAPVAQNIHENQNIETMRRNTVDFWTELYASLYAKPDLNKITGLLNKN